MKIEKNEDAFSSFNINKSAMLTEVYLDNSATTKPCQDVVEVMLHALNNTYANPSSLHYKGIEAERLVKAARECTADVIKSKPENVFFTSGGTESNNLAIQGYVNSNNKRGKHIITTRIEHPSVINVYEKLISDGYRVDYLSVGSTGMVDIDELQYLITDNTILVSIMHVNNETGIVQPVEYISKLIKSKNIECAFHSDCVQSYAKIPIDTKKLNVDIISASAHKIHGPKGIGLLYVKKGTKMSPLTYGGQQENGIRPGTENVAGVCGFGEAAELSMGANNERYSRVKKCRDMLVNGITAAISDCHINSDLQNGSPYILNVSFVGVSAEVLLHSLESYGIYVSTVSACSSRNKAGSYVLKAMGLSDELIKSAIRFSFSHMNTEDEIEYVLETLKKTISFLRKYKRR